jgi:hypothetical protein
MAVFTAIGAAVGATAGAAFATGLSIVGSVVGLAATVAGTLSAADAADQQAEAISKQNKIQQGRAAVQRRAQVRRMLAQQRAARADTESGAVARGAEGSSSVQGALGSQGTQFATNLTAFNSEVLLSNMFNRHQGRISKLEQRKSTATAVAQGGSNIFASAGGFGTLFGAAKSINAPVVP